MERKKRGERRKERDEEVMRERDRWGSYWVREGVRLKKRERLYSLKVRIYLPKDKRQCNGVYVVKNYI